MAPEDSNPGAPVYPKGPRGLRSCGPSRGFAVKYRTYEELARHEIRGEDYVVLYQAGSTPMAVMAPHGGRIEPGTTEIARAISGTDHSFYSFVGMKARNNGHLHLASTLFDEPAALQMLQRVWKVLTIHGCAGEEARTLVGGKDRALVETVKSELRRSGFDAADAAAQHLRGVNPHNLCNLGLSRAGVQLEVSAPLRHQLMLARKSMGMDGGANIFEQFVSAVRRAIASPTEIPLHDRDP